MSNWWYATSVDVEQGSNLVRVNTGDDTRYFERGSCWLKITGHDAVETDGLITDGSDTFIRLVKDWSGGTDTARRAFAFRTVPDFQDVADKLALNIEASQGVVDNVIGKIGTVLTSTDESVVIETAEGDVQVVPYGKLAQTIENEWGAKKAEIDAKQARLDAEAKLKANAVVYLDFANNEGKEADDFTINRATATDLIDYTAPDGVSVQTADGRIVFAPANTAAIGWNNGECVGLVSAPASTNLLLWSEDFTQTAWSKGRVTASSSSELSPLGSAQKISATTESGVHSIYQNMASVSGQRFSAKWYVKADEHNQANIRWGTAGPGGTFIGNITVDIANGTIVQQGGGIENVKISKLVNGFYLIESQAIAVSEQISSALILVQGGQTAFAGDGTSGIIAGGAQLEQGYPTPYIKTEASQVTRGVAVSAANSVRGKLNIRNFSIYQEVTFNEIGHDRGLIGYRSGATSGFDTFINSNGTVLFRPAIGGDASSVVNSGAGQIEAGRLAKILTWHDGDSFYIAVNGEVFQSSSGLSGMIDPLTSIPFRIGTYSQTVRTSNSNWRKLIVTNTVPTTAEAIALTTLEDE